MREIKVQHFSVFCHLLSDTIKQKLAMIIDYRGLFNHQSRFDPSIFFPPFLFAGKTVTLR
jgi:hypothetical protein